MDDAALDRLLRALPAAQVSPALRAAVLAAAPRPRAGRAVGQAWWWSFGAGWAAAAGAGVILGAMLPPGGPSDVEQAFAIDEAVWPEEAG